MIFHAIAALGGGRLSFHPLIARISFPCDPACFLFESFEVGGGEFP
jgi:hypothetical protein